MANIIDIISDYYPANNDVGVPTGDPIWILFDIAVNEDLLKDNFFVVGPDTDQFVGPGFNLLEFPNNVSQGDQDFLTSPNYQGWVQGTFSFQHISLTDPTQITNDPVNYRTKMFFTPSHPLTPETPYRSILPQVTDLNMNIYTGTVEFDWTSGSGSITALPTTASSSILNSVTPTSPLNTLGDLEVVSVTPADFSIKNDPGKFNQIVIEFNKQLDATSINPDLIDLKALPVTDHPDLNISAVGEMAKRILVNGNKLIIQF